MEVNNVNGAGAISFVSQVGLERQGTENGAIKFTKEETEFAQKTKKRIEAIRYEKVSKMFHPETSPEEQKKLEAEIKKIDQVYKNVKYTVNPDGSVSFNFEGYVNTEDFKLAFGIKDGELQEYLKKRHNAAVNNGEVYAVDLVMSNGETYQVNEPEYYENMQEMRERINGELEAVFRDDYWSTLTYSDGYIRSYGKTLLSVYNDVGDYRNMTLGPEDNEKIMLQVNAFKDN